MWVPPVYLHRGGNLQVATPLIVVGMSLLDELLAIPQLEIAEWPEKEQAWYANMLARETALASPARFAEAHSNGLWTPYQHLEVTSDAIVSMVEEDDCDLLLIDQPVRHGKSQLCSKWTPPWYLSKYRAPTPRSVLLASYESTFAEKWGRDARAIIAEVGPRYGAIIRSDSRAAGRWELEGGGGMNTAGAGGPITGKGGHLLILDDPIKNREQAMSPTERQKLKEWWDTTWITRREGGGIGTKYLLIMSRWHVDDLMGWLLSREDEIGMRIKRLRMPAVAEDDDMIGRAPGQALCPELFDEQDLADIKKDSPLAWPSLYQQRPVPEGGGMFKRDDFRTFTRKRIDGDEYWQLDDRLVAKAECLIFATMDTAYTKSKRSDYTALGIWAVTPGNPSDLILLNMYRKRVNHAEHGPLLMQAWNEWRPRWVGLEKITATLSLFAEAQREGVVMRWLKPDKNKVARAETAVAMTEQHRVWIPESADMAEFLEECVTFPSGAHDDMVDVFAYAAAEVYKRAVKGRHRIQQPQSHDEMIWKKIEKMQKPDTRDPVLGRWR